MTTVIGYILSFIIISLLYPLIVLAIFLGIIITVIGIVFGGREENRIRRAIGAILPIIVLAFIINSTGEHTKNSTPTRMVNVSLHDLAWWQQSLIIAIFGIIGVALVEIGRFLLNKDSEIAASVYAMLLSCVISFIMWLYMYQALSDFDFYMIGFISGGLLDTIFRGVPSAVNINKDVLWSIFFQIKISSY
jgi:hypothetical protein